MRGVYVWAGPVRHTTTHDPAGAWHFNLTTDVIGGSDDLLDLYGVAPELRRHQRHTAEAFTRLIPNTDVAAALAKIVRSEPGEQHQAIWTVLRDDGQRRAAHFSARAIAEKNDRVRLRLSFAASPTTSGLPKKHLPQLPPSSRTTRARQHDRAGPIPGNHQPEDLPHHPMAGRPHARPRLGAEQQNPLPWIHDDDLLAAKPLPQAWPPPRTPAARSGFAATTGTGNRFPSPRTSYYSTSTPLLGC